MSSSTRAAAPVLTGRRLREAVRTSVGRHVALSDYQVYLFGSEASGAADRRSDIDVGILGPRPIPGAVLEAIRADLETVRTLRVFDVVDLASADESFRAVALTHAERL
jgi:uncharacterized protein